jgi:adenylate cyclase
MKKILLSPWLAVITLLVFVGIRWHDPGFIESVRLRYFDQLITSQPATEVPVHVINIDEAAMSKYGQYPFSRDIYANIIRDLYRRDAGLVVFGIMMPEADRFKKDQVLADTLKSHAVILPSLGHTSSKNTAHGGTAIVIGGDPKGAVVEFPGMISNIDILGELASGVGIVNTFPEVDGVVRRTPLVILHKDRLYPSLALETLRVAAGDKNFQVKIGEGGIEALRVPRFGKIGTDNLSRVWIDWAAAAKSHSLAELPASFNGEIVIVGVSAAGIANPVATSRGEVWPQDLQAAAIGTMIAGATIQRPQWSDSVEILMLAVLGVAVIAMSRYAYLGIFFCAMAIAFSMGFSFLAYSGSRFLLDATIPSIALICVALHAYSVKFATEFFKKLQIKRQFGSYVNPAIVERLQKNPEFINLGGEKRDLTIVMSDMRNFTGLGETFGDDVVSFTKMMNRYMTAISEPILYNNGCLIKFIGDASLHVHGAPIQEEQDPDHVVAAVRTSLEMIEAVKKFNLELEQEGKPHVGLGLGINTGPTLIGNIGAKTRFDMTF